jgi:low affinity Fe/Cu permease
MQTLIQLLKSKTVLFALFLAILSILQGYVNLLPLSPVDQMYVGIAISIVVTLLRIVTTQPISEK